MEETMKFVPIVSFVHGTQEAAQPTITLLYSLLLASRCEQIKLMSLWHVSRNALCDPTDPRLLRTGVLYSASLSSSGNWMLLLLRT